MLYVNLFTHERKKNLIRKKKIKLINAFADSTKYIPGRLLSESTVIRAWRAHPRVTASATPDDNVNWLTK